MINNQNLQFKKSQHIYNKLTFTDDTSHIAEIFDDNTDLTDNSIIYENKNILNISSEFKNQDPYNIISNDYLYLENNPLYFTANSNLIKIFHKNHNFTIQDKIIIQNVVSNLYESKGGISLSEDSEFIKITYLGHNITQELIDTDFQIDISGIVGNKNFNEYIENIPLFLINKIHKNIYLNTNIYPSNENYFFVKIDIKANNNYIDIKSNLKIKYLNLNGINLNKINANYPINIYQTQGFHVINKIIDNNNFEIMINNFALNTINLGSNDIYIAKINKTKEADTNNNKFKITLDKSLYNVSKILLRSVEIPNTYKMIRNKFSSNQNNKLYWQTLNYGSEIYYINLIQGNYNSQLIKNEIESKINNTNIKLYDTNIYYYGLQSNTMINKSKYFYSQVTISSSTNIFKLELFHKIFLRNAIYKSNTDNEDKQINIIIYHKDHNLYINDDIIISGCSNTEQIPKEFINKKHTIIKIIDKNSYELKLNYFNEITTSIIGGGNEIIINIPIKFRLLFDKNDTCGKILGFKNVNNKFSITPFNFYVSNNEPYENDTLLDVNGNKQSVLDDNTLINNNILKYEYNYIIISCSFLNDKKISNIINSFSKIQLKKTTLLTDFIQLFSTLNNPIEVLNEIEFSLYYPDGTSYDLYNQPISLTLLVYEKQAILNKTRLNIKNNTLNLA